MPARQRDAGRERDLRTPAGVVFGDEAVLRAESGITEAVMGAVPGLMHERHASVHVDLQIVQQPVVDLDTREQASVAALSHGARRGGIDFEVPALDGLGIVGDERRARKRGMTEEACAGGEHRGKKSRTTRRTAHGRLRRGPITGEQHELESPERTVDCAAGDRPPSRRNATGQMKHGKKGRRADRRANGRCRTGQSGERTGPARGAQ